MDLQNKTRDLFGFLVEVGTVAKEISTADTTEFLEVCGGDGVALGLVQDASGYAAVQSCILAQLLVGVRDFFSCDNWHPIYAKAAHDALCYQGAEGFSYIATAQFVVVFCALILLTLRSSFYEIRDEEDEESRRGCWARCTGPCRRKPEDEEAGDGDKGEKGDAAEGEEVNVAEVEEGE